MLLQLSIENLALIDSMTIDFAPGMNVMTGETGAGKSIVVDAVNLVLGERADRDLIQNGKKKARVEAVFDIADNDKVKALLGEMELEDDEDMASISRELTSTGKNICRINGTVVPLQTLKQVSAQLLDIHGQHEHQLLLDSKNHIGYLDGYAADEIHPLLDETGKRYAVWREIGQKLSRLRKNVAEREQRIDMLRFQLEELRGAHLVEGEEEELERQNFDRVLAEEEAWIRRGVKARLARNEGRVRNLEAMRAERAARRDRQGRAIMQISEADRSGNIVFEAQNITVTYEGQDIIKDFAPTVMRGDRIGIVGPNGAGKTTLIKVLMDLINCSSRKIFFYHTLS